ncbi:dUTPase [Bacillus phage BC-5]|uniref:dUTPase n=1 Tax=Bacillus phage BC-5 TaxID=3020389 RepID=A0AAE9YFB4_9CAUD|nr:dUTPase [Bacillus phage BC-5]
MILNLLNKQKEVDSYIAEKVNDKYIKEGKNKDFKDTIGKRKVAFKVELCELANEIGFFKYWKESHVINKDRVLDEWADCLAFLNSIVVTQNYERHINEYLQYCVLESSMDVNYHFDRLMKNKLYDLTDYEYAYIELYKMGSTLGFSFGELNVAYLNKSEENIRRAKEGY